MDLLSSPKIICDVLSEVIEHTATHPTHSDLMPSVSIRGPSLPYQKLNLFNVSGSCRDIKIRWLRKFLQTYIGNLSVGFDL